MCPVHTPTTSLLIILIVIINAQHSQYRCHETIVHSVGSCSTINHLIHNIIVIIVIHHIILCVIITHYSQQYGNNNNNNNNNK